jgi:hypothetical protein
MKNVFKVETTTEGKVPKGANHVQQDLAAIKDIDAVIDAAMTHATSVASSATKMGIPEHIFHACAECCAESAAERVKEIISGGDYTLQPVSCRAQLASQDNPLTPLLDALLGGDTRC